MRIGINLLYLIPGVVGGTETYAAGLLHGLSQVDHDDEFVVLVNQESVDWSLPKTASFTRVACPIRATSRARRYLFEQLQLPLVLQRHKLDLVHSCGYVAPLLAPCPSVVTIHDLNHRAFGDLMPSNRRLALAFFTRQSALRARMVITVSQFARGEICETFGIPPERVAVTHEAPRQPNYSVGPFDAISKDCDRLGVRDPHIVAFSSQSPHKNVHRLLEAFAKAKQRWDLPHQLVVVGHKPPVEDSLSTAVQGLDPTALLFTGYLDDPSLQAVLASARFLTFPSTYEGFGLPILEAMAAGVPVVCSNQASLPEVAGEAALFFDPFSIEDMAQKIAQLARDGDLRVELRGKGFENVQRFSWEKTARETLAVYRHVHDLRSSSRSS